jgi:hypothetical protein
VLLRFAVFTRVGVELKRARAVAPLALSLQLFPPLKQFILSPLSRCVTLTLCRSFHRTAANITT